MSIDLATVDGVVEALYKGVSFSPGAEPDYQLIRSLFHAQGRVTAPKEDTEGIISPINVDQFVIRFKASLEAEGIVKVGASEQEIHRKTLIFRRIAHVFSGYQFELCGADAPLTRGINTIQLVFDCDRWWILSLSWDRAKPDDPLTVQSSETAG